MSDKTLSFNIVVDGVSNEAEQLAKIEYQLRNIKREKSELDKMAAKGFLSNEDRARLAAYNKDIETQTKLQKELKMVNGSASDSLDRMRAKLIRMKDAFGSSSAEVREKMAPAINNLNAQISKSEQAIGVHQRNVGNYPTFMNTASKTFENFGNKVRDSFTQLAAGGGIIAIAITAFNKLKETILSTETGLNAFNIAGEVTRQLLYDFATTGKISADNLIAAADAAKKLNDIRIGARKDLIEFARLNREIAQLEFDAADKTKTRAEREEALSKAIAKQNELSDAKIADVKEELIVVTDLLEKRKDDATLLDKQSNLIAKIYDLDRERFEQSKRNESRMTGFIAAENAEREKYYENLQAWLDAIEKEQEEKEIEDARKKKEAAENELQEKIKIEKDFVKAKEDNAKNMPQMIEGYEAKSLEVLRDFTGLTIEEIEKRAKAVEAIEQGHADAKYNIAITTTNLLAGIAGKNKDLQKVSLAADKAYAIAQIIIQTRKANAAMRAWGALAGPIGMGVAQAAIIKNNVSAGLDIAAIVAATALTIAGYKKGGRINEGVTINTGMKDDTLILANKTETVLTDKHVAMLGGSGVMRRIGVPGYAEGGYVGQIAPEIGASGFDYDQLARLMNSIEVKLDINKVNSAQREVSLINETQRI